MMTYDEVLEAIERGFIKGDKISIVRRNGKIHDYVLPGEKVESGEIVTEEDVETVLEELRKQDVREFLFEKYKLGKMTKVKFVESKKEEK